MSSNSTFFTALEFKLLLTYNEESDGKQGQGCQAQELDRPRFREEDYENE